MSRKNALHKTWFALAGTICVLLVAVTSVEMAYAWIPSTPSLRPCNKVPSYYLMGTEIDPWNFQTQTVSRKGFSFLKGFVFVTPWSTASNDPKWNKVLSYGTRYELYVDGKKQFLLTDVCYDVDGSVYGSADTLWKFSYMQYFPYQWKAGSHTFRVDFFSEIPTPPGTVVSTVTFT